jgi:hypothetical protein
MGAFFIRYYFFWICLLRFIQILNNSSYVFLDSKLLDLLYQLSYITILITQYLAKATSTHCGSHYVSSNPSCFCWHRNVVLASLWSCSPCNMGPSTRKVGSEWVHKVLLAHLPSHIHPLYDPMWGLAELTKFLVQTTGRHGYKQEKIFLVVRGSWNLHGNHAGIILKILSRE